MSEFENVPVENLSDWEVSQKATGVWEDVKGITMDGDNAFTEVKVDSREEPIRFSNPDRSGKLFNEEFAVRLKYGKESVNRDAIVDDMGIEIPKTGTDSVTE